MLRFRASPAFAVHRGASHVVAGAWPTTAGAAATTPVVVGAGRGGAAASAPSAEDRLRALQRLPKLPQIVANLPHNWKAAASKFGRQQYMEPTRPPGASVRDDDPLASKQRGHDRVHDGDDDADLRNPLGTQMPRDPLKDEPTMPLPRTPVVQVVPDTRLRIALVGAVNAGKSALWNKLCANFERATNAPRVRVPQIVMDAPGMTRDAIEGVGQLGDAIFTLVDTPGVIDGQILDETRRAVESCHAAIFVVGCDRDIGAEEHAMAKYLAGVQRLPVVAVLAKADLGRHRVAEFQREIAHALGAGVPVPVSTYTDAGFDDLERVVHPLLDIQARVRTWRDWAVEDAALAGDAAALEEVRMRNTHERAIRVAFIGRTCSGKSSLINCLLGKYRSRSRAGEYFTTRDTVETECVFRGKRFQLIDTAPSVRMRHRRERDFVAQLHNSTMRAVQFADICVIVFDAREGHPSGYDMSLAHMCIDEGRPFMFAANRWDQVIDASATAEAIDFKIKRQINEVRYSNAVVTSSLTVSRDAELSPEDQSARRKKQAGSNGQQDDGPPAVGLNLALLMKELMVLNENWNRKLHSRDLTRFWRKLEKSVNIPMKNTRIHRIVQSHARPPTFILRLVSKDGEGTLKPVFTNLIRNALVEEFGLRGTPIRLLQENKSKHPDITT